MAEPPLVAVHIPTKGEPVLREDIVNDGSGHQVILPDAMYPTMTVSVLYGPGRKNVCIMTGLYSSAGLHAPFPVALTNEDLDLFIEALTAARAQQGEKRAPSSKGRRVIVSRTDKTAPHWVRVARGIAPFIRACGTGCSYCGMSKVRRRFDTHRTRAAAKRALRMGDWQREY